MPELPDLQVFRKNLEKKLEAINREGKELFFVFEGEQVLAFHLMLNGEFHFFNESNNYKNKILDLLFEDKTGLALTDWQKYANVVFNPEKPEEPDVLSKEFNQKYLEEGFKEHKLENIKNLLLDQKFVRGLSNACVDEILWDAKIHPLSKVGKITSKVIKELYNSINKVLIEAEEEINKKHPDIIRGEIRDFLKIHNSKFTHSPTGGIIKKENIGSRITYYTDEQILYE